MGKFYIFTLIKNAAACSFNKGRNLMKLKYFLYVFILTLITVNLTSSAHNINIEQEKPVISKLVVYFHGLFGNSTISIKQIQKIGIINSSNTEFLTPNAEEIGYGIGTWYPLQRNELEKLLKSNTSIEKLLPFGNFIQILSGIICNIELRREYETFLNIFGKAYLKKIHDYLDKELKKRGLTDEHLVLMGYSMGGIIAQHVGLTRDNPCMAVIAINSFYFPIKTVSKPKKILVCNNENDQIIPISLAKTSYSILEKEPYSNLEKYISMIDPGHNIGKDEIQKIQKWFESLSGK